MSETISFSSTYPNSNAHLDVKYDDSGAMFSAGFPLHEGCCSISREDVHALAFAVLGPDVVQPPLPPMLEVSQVWRDDEDGIEYRIESVSELAKASFAVRLDGNGCRILGLAGPKHWTYLRDEAVTS